MKNHKYILLGSAALLLAILVFSVLGSGNYIQGPCILLPEYEWALSQPQPGELYWETVCNNPKRVDQFKLLRTERSDLLDFSLNLSLDIGDSISNGMLIGYAQSVENHFKVSELQSLLKEEEAKLQILTSGEKKSVQEEFENSYKYTQAQMEEFDILLNSKSKLFKQKLISEEEWKSLQAKQKLLDINIAIAKAQLLNAQTGVKTEEIEYTKSRIENIIEQLKWLQKKISAEKIQSPIQGIVAQTMNEGNIFKVINSKNLVVHIPVSANDLYKVEKQARVVLEVPGNSSNHIITFVRSISDEAQLINNKMMHIVYAVIDNSELKIRPGTRGYAKVDCKGSSLIQRIKNSFQEFKLNI